MSGRTYSTRFLGTYPELMKKYGRPRPEPITSEFVTLLLELTASELERDAG
jgi:hypothetical protein